MTKRTAAKVAFVLTWLYLLAFMVGTVVLGGDAIDGYAAHGHYFLNDRGHFTEVSRAVFLYSKWHSITCMIIAPSESLAVGMPMHRTLEKIQNEPLPSWPARP
jgi:hypothetical protein